jgi:hypothetical protein
MCFSMIGLPTLNECMSGKPCTQSEYMYISRPLLVLALDVELVPQHRLLNYRLDAVIF